jgi:hypothetical protein
MKTWIKLAGAIALVAVSHSALAFQEEAPAGAARPAPAAEIQAPLAPGLDSVVPRQSQGTPVKIPGLGTIGVLPRVDFGLDLLYGQADGKPGSPRDTDRSNPDDGVAIRGSVKHRF